MQTEAESNLEEPGHHEDWDYEGAVVVEGRPRRGSTFSVRFAAGEIGELKRFAEAHGMTTGEFIRRAALDAMHKPPQDADDVFAALRELANRTGTAVLLVPRPELESGRVVA